MRKILLFTLLLTLGITGCSAKPASDTTSAVTEQKTLSWDEMEPTGQLPLAYAKQFQVDRYEGGYDLIQISEVGKYLTIPENGAVPQDLPDDITVLQKPLDHIYLAATAAMDLVAGIDETSRVTLSSLQPEGWYIDAAKEAMERGEMTYAGKYSAPDYELLIEEGCDLALESSMIYHSPEVKEQLEKIGIPVLVERSSYESDPLARMEWIKLYGVLFDEEERANARFEEELSGLDGLLDQPQTGKTAAFFYVTSKGVISVRKSGDYVAKMIDLAGGTYVPQGLGNENALSTMNLQMEEFYDKARDADFLIYSGTIDGGIKSIDQLIDKNPLFADFRAVKEGNVWGTQKNMYQETLGIGAMIQDFHRLFSEETPDPSQMTYLYPIQ